MSGGLDEPHPDSGCPDGSTVCDQFVGGVWPDMVLLAVLVVCGAACLFALVDWLWRRRR